MDLTDSIALDASSVAFKEWAGVCEAVGSGRQTLLFRKGGIAEESGRFRPEHPAFWLYPTAVHQAEQGLREGFDRIDPAGQAGSIDLTAFVVVSSIRFVESEATLRALEPFHVWDASTVSKKFGYRRPGLWVLGVRAYRQSPPRRVAVRPEFAGCKTWVNLGDSLATAGLVPVLGDAEAAHREAAMASALGRTA